MLYSTFVQAEGKEHTMTLRDHLLNGYADAQAQTPWTRCTMTVEAWKAGATETAETTAYWNGFNAAVEDAFSKASQ